MQVGRHFQETDELYSVITRNSIDTLKEHFRAEAEPSDWALMCVALSLRSSYSTLTDSPSSQQQEAQAVVRDRVIARLL